MEGGDSEFVKFTLLTLKAVLRHIVRMCLATSSNLLLMLQDAPNRIFPHSCFSGQPKNYVKTLFHPPSPFPCNFCNCNSGGICTAWQFWVKLLLLYTAWTNTYWEISPEVTAATFCNFLRKRLWRAFTHANQLYWTTQYTNMCVCVCVNVHVNACVNVRVWMCMWLCMWNVCECMCECDKMFVSVDVNKHLGLFQDGAP